MKDIVKEVVERLKADVDVITALGGDNINPVIAPQGQEVPSMQYSISGSPISTLKFNSLVSTEFTFTILAKTYEKCIEIHDAVFKCLDPVSYMNYFATQDDFEMQLDAYVINLKFNTTKK